MADAQTSVDLIYDVVKEALAAQQKQKDTLETKASTLIAFAGAIFALLMTGYSTLVSFGMLSKIFIVVSVVAFGISVVLLIVVTWVRQLRSDPNPIALATPVFLNNEPQKTRLQLISNWTAAWEENHSDLERRAKFLRWAFFAQAVGFILLGLGLLVTLG
jgi:hypothetical protein